ncbi:MAG: serine/threonine-protein phosphatase, partial [Thauera sp.]|nr:serine/threonine-protein phosphatase [Thauera sp.]
FELASTLQEFPARAAAERLVALGRERAGGSGDNISLAIVKLIEAPATPARPAASR